MLIKLENGSIYDPDLNCHGDIGNLFIQDGIIIADAALLFKNGQMVVQDGVVINKLTGLAQTIAMKAWQPCLQ
ncbi:hypothetical protein [Methyloprofundus sp.]|uniref:hypothetical protein n=1 Tax=Methyloprofundus sp. TaxID=2020875 RepID=UPI003D0F8B8A